MRYSVCAVVVVAFLLFSTTASATCSHGTRHEVLVQALQEEFPDINELLDPLCAEESVLSPPSPIKTWGQLEQVVLEVTNATRAQQLFESNYETLLEVQAEYGVPPNYIMAFLMVESLGGSHLGHYPVIDTLYNRHEYGTPKQRQSARGQLRSFLRTRPWESCNCGTIYDLKGSSSGALGLPQFMPYAVEHHSVDADGDGIINLFALPDAAASVAKHLTDNGWHRDRHGAIEMYNHHPRYREIVENVARHFNDLKPPPLTLLPLVCTP